jgi:hypothetical protein
VALRRAVLCMGRPALRPCLTCDICCRYEEDDVGEGVEDDGRAEDEEDEEGTDSEYGEGGKQLRRSRSARTRTRTHRAMADNTDQLLVRRTALFAHPAC